jgi:Rad3-related DNA helicase
MAFKKNPPQAEVPDSPDRLFLDLPRRKIPSVLPHQRDIMRAYASNGLDKTDVALQLPTGSGKTLVGLLIAEWLRRKNHERVVYLCPTRNLVNQVVEQGEEKYGLTVLPFTGRHQTYPAHSKTAYRNADHVAVTTYGSLFNTNSFFNDASVLILDDAHAAENYVTEHWSLRIDRNKNEHKTVHAALLNLLKPFLPLQNHRRLSGVADSMDDYSWVDKLPTPEFHRLIPSLIEIFDANVSGTDLRFPWSVLRDHLHACHLYLSTQGILIRPLISPTWSHVPFTSPRQRIYMSATLGSGGDLERLMGRRQITRMPIPDGWDRQGVGRRLFIFPGMSLEKDELQQLRLELIKRAGRSLILVPNDRLRDAIAKDIAKSLPSFRIFLAADMETSTKPFLQKESAVAIMANRYDGIDFPGQSCRLLFVEGLPKATNLQERFLMSRMGSNVLFNERVQTRVLQAIGRCTRSLEDYSAVVVLGEDLQNYLADKQLRRYLHPELQAELNFGVEQSKTGIS